MTLGYFQCTDCELLYNESNWMCPNCLAKYKELLEEESDSLDKNYKKNNI